MNKWCTEYLVIGYEYSNDRFKNSAVNGHNKNNKRNTLHIRDPLHCYGTQELDLVEYKDKIIFLKKCISFLL